MASSLFFNVSQCDDITQELCYKTTFLLCRFYKACWAAPQQVCQKLRDLAQSVRACSVAVDSTVQVIGGSPNSPRFGRAFPVKPSSPLYRSLIKSTVTLLMLISSLSLLANLAAAISAIAFVIPFSSKYLPLERWVIAKILSHSDCIRKM